MRIEGYEYEATPFASEGEAEEACRVAYREDKPIMGGMIYCLAVGGPYVVELYNDKNEAWYL
jgi:hypothetical protein